VLKKVIEYCLKKLTFISVSAVGIFNKNFWSSKKVIEYCPKKLMDFFVAATELATDQAFV
jgi:hypothetical protein